MNNTNDTEELLKAIDLTLDDVMKIIEEGVKKRYGAFKSLREITTADDLKQDVFLYYFSKMKSTGDVRINYYIKKYNDREHIINLIKQTAYQFPILQAQSVKAKNFFATLSLDEKIGDINDRPKTILDITPDKRAEAEIYSNVTSAELMQLLRDELNDLNISNLKQQYLKETKELRYSEYNLPFILDTENYIKANNRTLIQLQIVKDLCDGYPKKSLIEKYNSYKEDIEIIKRALFGRLYNYLRTSY